MKVHSILCTLIGASFILSSVNSVAQMGNLRAGVSKVDVSPTKDMLPIKNNQVFGSVHDPVFARALVIDNGSAKIAIVSVDLLDIMSDNGLVKAVADELKIPIENVMITPTHDDNFLLVDIPGPTPDSKMIFPEGPEFDLVRKGILQAVQQANANLQPARIGFGTGKAYVNTNRDQKIGDRYQIGYAPEGPSDKTVAVVLLTKPSGEPIAIYWNYAVHSVVMFHSLGADGQSQITGDLAGWAINYVEDHFEGAVALYSAGASGDQNPLFMSYYNQGQQDVHDEHEAGYAILDVESRRLGEEVVRVTRAIQNTTGQAVLWAAKSAVTCPGRKRADSPQQQGGQRGPVKMVDGDPVTIPLQLFMINDIAIAGIAGDFYTEIGMRTKQNSLFDRTMMVTLLPNAIGYIPSEEAYTLPTQMASTNRIKPGCAEAGIVDAFPLMMKQYLPVWQSAH